MKHPASATLFDHWQSLRHGRRVPDRNDLDPVAIRDVLAHTFMLEVDGRRPAARVYPVRVSGTRLDALFGRSVKDLGLAALWRPRHAAELQIIAADVLDEGRPAVVGGRGAPTGYAPVAIEMLMLPLRCRGQTHSRLLCSLVPLSTPGWLGLASVEPLELTTWRLIDTSSPALQPAAPRPLAVVRTESRRRFLVIDGGKFAVTPGAAAEAQSHVNAVVPNSSDAPLTQWSS